ncbi:MAG: CPBP family intramembrane glutamic endopeptidase [Bacteroidia bacterium]
MTQIINEIISTVLQILVFTLIPFIFFLLRKDKNLNFFRYIGLYKPTTKSLIYVVFVSLIFLIAAIGITFIDNSIKEVLFSPHTVTGKLRLMGLNATSVTILLIIALFKTSFAEEILFRGFIAKRLISKFGFNIGNVAQSAVFGVLHLLLFSLLIKTTFTALTFILIFSSLAGWIIGFIKDKYANGSIIPGWVAHGLGNTLSYFIIAFIL